MAAQSILQGERKRRLTTVAAIEAAAPGEYVIDSGKRGAGSLVLRVKPDGERAFYLRHIGGGKRTFTLVGYYARGGASGWWLDEQQQITHQGGRLSLAAAREGFRWLSNLAIATGGDPRIHLREQDARRAAERAAAARAAATGSFDDVLAGYIATLRARKAQSARTVELQFERHIRKPFPSLLKLKAGEIGPEHIEQILARCIEKGLERGTNLVRNSLHAAFNVAMRAAFDPRRRAEGVTTRFNISSNPVAMIARIAEYDRIGERVPTAEELGRYQVSLDKVESLVVQSFLRVHLHTAQRPLQLSRAKWSDVDRDNWVLRLIDSKGRGARPREHLVPIPEAVRPDLQVMRDLTGPWNGYVWTTTKRGTVPLTMSGVTRLASAITQRIVGKKGEPFTLRDVRRGCETLLASKNVPKETRSQLLSHDRGGIIARTYDKHAYLEQKREALGVWTAHLAEAREKVERRPAKVVKLQKRRAA